MGFSVLQNTPSGSGSLFCTGYGYGRGDGRCDMEGRCRARGALQSDMIPRYLDAMDDACSYFGNGTSVGNPYGYGNGDANGLG